MVPLLDEGVVSSASRAGTGSTYFCVHGEGHLKAALGNPEAQSCCCQAGDGEVAQEEHEVALVVQANATLDPGAATEVFVRLACRSNASVTH